eukprot:XP_011603162.1 PREDICTED: uncharacterized protein LOC101075518 [Takifugu rubripes]
MEKNIFALLTHSDGGPPDNALTALADAQIKYAKDEQGQPVHFVFNNCQSAQRTGRYTRKLKNAWEDSEDEMKQFMEVLNVTEAQTLRTTVEVINQRHQLKECIINIQDKLKFIELKKKEIDQEKALHIKCKEKMKANKNYEEDVDERYKDKEPIEGGRCGFLWLYCMGAHEGLESIALKVDSIFTLKHLDFLIERMQDEKFAEEVRKLKEMKQRMEGVCSQDLEGQLRKAQAWFKYKNITETSQLIQSGSPEIYRLNSVTKITEGLKTVTVGTKKVNRLNKTILLLGETGTGKSTLIDLLVNYATGVKWGDEVWFKIVEEETTSQSESQTSDVIMYQIFGFEGKRLPFSLTLVDTPGYGDNRDDTNDDIIGERLLEWFSTDGGVHEINAVGLVLKASDNRLSDRLGYVFDSVASLFGANMEENMFALLTHCHQS